MDTRNNPPGLRGWWAVLHSDDLLDYLRQAHNGDDPSMVLAKVYLDADTSEFIEPAGDGCPDCHHPWRSHWPNIGCNYAECDCDNDPSSSDDIQTGGTQ